MTVQTNWKLSSIQKIINKETTKHRPLRSFLIKEKLEQRIDKQIDDNR